MRDLMSVETVTAFPLDARMTWISSDGTPSVREMPLRGAVVSLIRPRSPSLTGTAAGPCETGPVEPDEAADAPGLTTPAGSEGDCGPTTKLRRSSAVRSDPRTSTGSVVPARSVAPAG